MFQSKRIVSIFAVMLLIYGRQGMSSGGAKVVVDIPDSNLHAVIESALGKELGAPITVADMETLTDLEAEDASISDLTGLEFAINLTWLNLGYNSVSDMSPLAGLTNLTELDLDDNSISNIPPLADLTNLGSLSLTDNLISDVSPLAGMTTLTGLNLVHNSISDI